MILIKAYRICCTEVWILTVNVQKPKIVVFRNGECINNKEKLEYNGDNNKVANQFNYIYFGMLFNYNGNPVCTYYNWYILAFVYDACIHHYVVMYIIIIINLWEDCLTEIKTLNLNFIQMINCKNVPTL